MNNTQHALDEAISTLTLIATPRRPDGTYNRDRAACEALARETLAKIDRTMGTSPVEPQSVQTAVPASSAPASLAPSESVSTPVAAASEGAASVVASACTSPSVQSGNTFIVNSDGACKGNPGPAGWGISVQDANGTLLWGEGRFLCKQTNQIAELMGALEGLRRTPVGAKVTLISDSQYVLKGLNEWRHGWIRNGWKTFSKAPVKNKELWVALVEEADKRKVTVQWVRGHSGDPMNELCDHLANRAVAERSHVVASLADAQSFIANL